MPQQSQSDAMPLMRAAAAARVGYTVALTAVLKGELRGWQNERTGRWFVSAADLKRWRAQRAARGLARAAS